MTDIGLPIEAVLFDYGLVLSGPPDPAAWSIMRHLTGLDEPTLERAYWIPRHDYDRGTLTGEQYWRAVGQAGGISLDSSHIHALIDADTALWTQLNEPMVAWAARLQAAGVRTGILSNLGDAMTAGLLAKFDWLTGFHHKVFSYALRLAKPELAIYRHAAEGLGVDPARILFVDDREENIAGALAAGMQAIRYTAQDAFEQELQERGWAKLWLEQ